MSLWSRVYQFTLIGSTLGLCWLGMQIVHELGHVLAAWLGGETVHRVVLHPLTISRTDTTLDQHPWLVLWGGPLVGVLLPMAALAVVWRLAPAWAYLVRFFAGFCLIANGAYLGAGAIAGLGDAGELIGQGTPRWVLIGFGLACVPAGLFLWHGLGPHFGLGEARSRVDPRAAWLTLGLLLALVLVEILVGSR